MPSPSHHPVVALERAALARWCTGDPGGFLELSAEDVVYFDPVVPTRVDGRPALAAYYAPITGKIFASEWRMIDPAVTEIGEAAVLTFRFVSSNGDGPRMRWNCTEVYRRTGDGWKIAATHWSFTGDED